MKHRVITLFFFLITLATYSFLVGPGFCEVYYVKFTGDDNATGLSDQEAWKTISKVNRFVFADGDVVRLNRGDVFDDATLKSPGVDNFTIEDYGTGAKPLIDGDKIRPIYINDAISNLTIRNIDISGQDWLATKGPNIDLDNVNGITLDGVEGNGHRNYGGVKEAKNAIEISRPSGVVEIKNCFLYNWGPATIPSGTGFKDYMAIHIDNHTSGSISIHDNIVHDIESDAVHIQFCTVPTKAYNNRFYNCGENSWDNKGSQNVTLYNNHFYREASFMGQGGAPTSHNWPLVHLHGNRGRASKNIVVRNNLLEGSDNIAIDVHGTGSSPLDDVKIYRNRIVDCKFAFALKSAPNNVEIYNNIVDGVKAGGCFVYENNSTGKGNKVYNNTFYSNANMNVGFDLHLDASAYTLYNYNIIYMNDSNSPLLDVIGDPGLNSNCWYNAGSSSVWLDHNGTTYSRSQQTAWINAGHPNALLADPIFENAAAGNFSLSDSSPCILDGMGAIHTGSLLEPPKNLRLP